ncbi:MAG TPA: bifunctional phosphopantothenoylcysteine decarboxylase/phosphopantothenate--cysteine ligase CoaBC [Candidatus Saccharicenans sp.]|jgi:phosphopantothenoylcysteine decarboxylase/phosphopantothenate--cysteine ligase|nr:bifunctional phosphopantothenoylcysteine decarboxylase/phosphopantothenate--cysteine ligase CoaBC [Candidatus Saccharicenans sp.]HRD01639.1 bifunctional phosphopantothenoylcysteine decarboxylase/phosphopantothenate--cysteine ligase CoaBC [Candidatus Saccharicenans sp.]
MNKIALGVASSISIYKAADIIRLFQKEDLAVRVIMTEKATRFIQPDFFTALSGEETIVNLFDRRQRPIEHIALADEISLLLIAPATANIIAKLASGLADDFLSTFYLAVKSPVLIAPAMNEAMFLHPQTQANIKKLRDNGVEFVEPEAGYLACGQTGGGRLASPEKIVQTSLRLIRRQPVFKDKLIVVTAGPTRESLDPVRFLSNRSSGKMGYELARQAYQLGAEVVLIKGPVELEPPTGVKVETVVSSEEMRQAVFKYYDQASVVIMSAAVSDFRFRQTSLKKIRKEKLTLNLELERTPDILEELGHLKRGQLLVGFAAETADLKTRASDKMKRKKLDLIVANDVSREDIGFGRDENEVYLFWPDGRERLIGKTSKRKVSQEILTEIGAMLNERKGNN